MALPFSSSTEAWRAYLGPLNDEAHGGTDFQLAWINKESGGNPCSFPYKTGEAGIWQLMPSTVRGNTGNDLDHAGTTAAEQHPIPPCAANSETRGVTVNDLTQDQIDAQIRAGRTYLDYCISTVQTALDAAGSTIDQTNPDFWKFVKLVQGAPAWVKSGIGMVTNELGTPLTSWDDFETIAVNHGCWGSNNCTNTLANARSVGAYGGSDPQPSLVDQLTVLQGPDVPLSGFEMALIGLAAIGGLYAAIRFDRWIGGGKSM